MGDTLAHDKFVGLVKGPTTNNPICRYCKCSFDDTDNPRVISQLTTMKEMVSLMDKRNYRKIKNLGYYSITNNAFYKLWYCDEKSGVHGAVPLESLHFLLLGYFMYALGAINKLRKENLTTSRYVFGGPYKSHLNQTCKYLGLCLSRQPLKLSTRTHFPTGYLPETSRNKAAEKTAKKTGQELVGVLLCILLFLLQDDEATILEKLLGEDRYGGYVGVMTYLILIENWCLWIATHLMRLMHLKNLFQLLWTNISA